jgi:hypothetical protein
VTLSKTLTIGDWTIRGDSDKEIVSQYIIGTLKSMAGYDRLELPYEFLDKLAALIESIPADEVEGCVDGVEPDI